MTIAEATKIASETRPSAAMRHNATGTDMPAAANNGEAMALTNRAGEIPYGVSAAVVRRGSNARVRATTAAAAAAGP